MQSDIFDAVYHDIIICIYNSTIKYTRYNLSLGDLKEKKKSWDKMTGEVGGGGKGAPCPMCLGTALMIHQ